MGQKLSNVKEEIKSKVEGKKSQAKAPSTTSTSDSSGGAKPKGAVGAPSSGAARPAPGGGAQPSSSQAKPAAGGPAHPPTTTSGAGSQGAPRGPTSVNALAGSLAGASVSSPPSSAPSTSTSAAAAAAGAPHTVFTQASSSAASSGARLGAAPGASSAAPSAAPAASSSSSSSSSAAAAAAATAAASAAAASSSAAAAAASAAAAAATAPGSDPAAAAAAAGDFSHYNSKLTIDDFDLLKVLGKGSFGKVMLVKRKGDDSQTLYAMKTLRKAALIKRNQLAHTSTERTILQSIHCPFLVHLIFAFQTQDKLYMVLDYMAGGELFFWLKKDRKFSENRVRLYTAEITLALEALHRADIVYRDLKPENILLDSVGHLRLTDFGLAKGGITGPGAEGGTKTFCGTPEYLAPEILENKGHGKGVDWWALGTLVFEMLTGLPPFYDTNVQRMYHKILHEPLRFPKGERLQLSEPSKDLLRGMLERKVSDRLGCGAGAAGDIKRSAFFVSLDFNKVLAREYTPEFCPPAASSLTDVRNFDTEFTSEQAADSMVVSHMTATMQEKTRFDGFTYQDKRL